jgi:hypothetical protein
MVINNVRNEQYETVFCNCMFITDIYIIINEH